MFIENSFRLFQLFSPLLTSLFPSFFLLQTLISGFVILKYLMHHNDFLHDQSERVEQYWTKQQNKVVQMVNQSSEMLVRVPDDIELFFSIFKKQSGLYKLIC